MEQGTMSKKQGVNEEDAKKSRTRSMEKEAKSKRTKNKGHGGRDMMQRVRRMEY